MIEQIQNLFIVFIGVLIASFIIRCFLVIYEAVIHAIFTIAG